MEVSTPQAVQSWVPFEAVPAAQETHEVALCLPFVPDPAGHQVQFVVWLPLKKVPGEHTQVRDPVWPLVSVLAGQGVQGPMPSEKVLAGQV